MRKLSVFEHISLDGFFSGANGDLSWARKGGSDPEVRAFVAQNAGGGGALLFGRKTYEMMASYWPTPLAAEHDPVVARGMNEREKYVFSRTLGEARWSGTRLVKDELVEAVRHVKQSAGAPLTILGSGSLVAQLTQAGLIDEYQLFVDPVVLGRGRTLFEGLRAPLELKLAQSRSFANGCVLLCYEAVR